MSEYAMASFADHVGDAFAVVGAPGTSLTLTAIEPLGIVADPATHAAFSLLFVGPPDPVYPQRLMTLAHPALGEVRIFLAPIAQDADGVTYEAVFN